MFLAISSTNTLVMVSVPPPAPYIMTTVIGLEGQFDAEAIDDDKPISKATKVAPAPFKTLLLEILLLFIFILTSLFIIDS